MRKIMWFWEIGKKIWQKVIKKIRISRGIWIFLRIQISDQKIRIPPCGSQNSQKIRIPTLGSQIRSSTNRNSRSSVGHWGRRDCHCCVLCRQREGNCAETVRSVSVMNIDNISRRVVVRNKSEFTWRRVCESVPTLKEGRPFSLGWGEMLGLAALE